MKTCINLLVVVFLSITIGCTQKTNSSSENESENTTEASETYTMDDFKTIKKVDSHVHIYTEGTTLMNLARAYNFRLIDISVDVSTYPPLNEQVAIRAKHHADEPDLIAFSTAFTLTDWDSENWTDRVIDQLKKDFEKGANSVKIWKNIGMEAKDKDGNLIMIDDPKFDPVFKFIKDQGKVLLSHAGEPKNCWLPLDSMTVKNDYDYFKSHPQYHMYLHPELPSYDDQIEARDNMLAKNPDIPFVAVHMASLEWSVDEAAKFLDRFPNASLDLAERVSHTQYQSQQDREKVRNFFIKYQDRILYATDFGQKEETDLENLKKYMMEVWLNDWAYFNTEEMVKVPQLDDPVKGLALPKQVIDKLYRTNAEKIFVNAWKEN
ncbi:MAG: amidohydrolase [Cyclobacteriaceae bacterium]|nr:amidohydrolase [Cyclobacteriaceae bacterium]